MKKIFGASDYKDFLPIPVCEDYPQYEDLYLKSWELAFAHIREIDGMPQSPYMDEAFCDTQIWIWDSCFMSLFCKYAQDIFPGVETLNNFYDVLYGGKSLPYIIPGKKEPKWTGAIPGQSAQIKIHIADNPPLFAWSEYENALLRGDSKYIKELLYERQILQKHYEWFENLKKPMQVKGVLCSTCLICEDNGYKWEGGRSGMDNTPRGRKTPNAEKERPNNPDMLWVDAICQQALAAKMIAKLFELIGDEKQSEEWNKKHLAKKAIVNRFYWDNEDKFFYDIDCNTKEFYKVKTVTSYWTLMSEISTKEQAKAMMGYIFDDNIFGGKVALVSLARNDNDFSKSGKYWRGSLWLPTAYVALKGLTKYGFFEEAQKAAQKILNHMLNTYINYTPHTIWECYSPEKAEPATVAENSGKTVRPDFCGWSALGPISIYIEFVLGFHSINAFKNIVEWQKPKVFKGKIGIKNLRFGKVITEIVAEGNICTVTSNLPYILKIDGKSYDIFKGNNNIIL